MTTINPTIFRAYDIRGVVGQELSEAVYHVLGQAAGTLFGRRGSKKNRGGPRCTFDVAGICGGIDGRIAGEWL